MARQDLEFVAETIAQAVEKAQTTSRVQRGIELRAQMHAVLATGATPDHYRWAWLSQSMDRTLEFVRGLCREFSDAHPDDMATNLDLTDILRFTANYVDRIVQAQAQAQKPG